MRRIFARGAGVADAISQDIDRVKTLWRQQDELSQPSNAPTSDSSAINISSNARPTTGPVSSTEHDHTAIGDDASSNDTTLAAVVGAPDMLANTDAPIDGVWYPRARPTVFNQRLQIAVVRTTAEKN